MDLQRSIGTFCHLQWSFASSAVFHPRHMCHDQIEHLVFENCLAIKDGNLTGNSWIYDFSTYQPPLSQCQNRLCGINKNHCTGMGYAHSIIMTGIPYFGHGNSLLMVL